MATGKKSAAGTKKSTTGKQTAARKGSSAGSTSAKSTATKGTSAKKTAARGASAAGKEIAAQEENFTREVILWLIVAISVLLVLSNFGLGGTIGNAVSRFFFGVFGLIAYVFPPVLLVGTFFAVSNRGNRIAVVKLVAMVLLVIFLCMFSELIVHGKEPLTGVEAWHYSHEHKTGGGFAGGLLAQLISSCFGLIGAYVIDAVVLIISLVLLTERSALRGVQKGGKKVYESAKISNERYRESAKQRREERELRREERLAESAKRRMDRKVQGVALDTRVLPEQDSDEISELYVQEPVTGEAGAVNDAYGLYELTAEEAMSGQAQTGGMPGNMTVMSGQAQAVGMPGSMTSMSGQAQTGGMPGNMTSMSGQAQAVGSGSVAVMPGQAVGSVTVMPQPAAGNAVQMPETAILHEEQQVTLTPTPTEPARNREITLSGLTGHTAGMPRMPYIASESEIELEPVVSQGEPEETIDLIPTERGVSAAQTAAAPGYGADAGYGTKQAPDDETAFAGIATDVKDILLEREIHADPAEEWNAVRTGFTETPEEDGLHNVYGEPAAGPDTDTAAGQDTDGRNRYGGTDRVQAGSQTSGEPAGNDRFADRQPTGETGRMTAIGDGMEENDRYTVGESAGEPAENGRFTDWQSVEETDRMTATGDVPEESDRYTVGESAGGPEERARSAGGMADRGMPSGRTIPGERFTGGQPDRTEPGQTAEEESPVAATVVEKPYVFPPVELLNQVEKKAGDSRQQLQQTAIKLQQTLKNFGVNVTITNISCGPAVTRYEIQPEMGVRVNKIVNLADDIKLNLAAADIRIEAPIPGKAAVGIEVPNQENTVVAFRELIESEEFQKHESKISFCVGKDIAGKPTVADIAKMPHLLIAGATGSGKSVCINTIVMSILYKADPKDVKLIMVDPKVVELSIYNGIPHLMIPVVTDPKKAAGALQWAVVEMDDRYQKFAEAGVRDLKGYNAKIDALPVIEGDPKPEKLPQIVIIVDELADLMMVAAGEVEESICRLAQLARACGIHLILATQRPSVNVITGLIKANMPSRIAFAVTSGTDSRTILDMNGAEKLLGKGDMLFHPQGIPKPVRVQGAFVTDQEVSNVVDFLKAENGQASYRTDMDEKVSSLSASGGGADAAGGGDGRDSYFADAARLIIDKDKASIGMLQRYFKIGFNRAARIMDQMEEAGIVGPEEGTKPRRVLMSPEQFEQYEEECL